MYAGLPSPNDRTFCPLSGPGRFSCYFFSASSGSYGAANADCANRGGYLASWGSYAEQLQVSSSEGTP
jgi:hypothetical protein